jgi:arylsulfatase A-like enzyme
MSFYEESVRTPLLIRWPGRIPAGSRSNACVSTVDLMPTLLGLAGCDIPKAVEGMDLAHLVLGKGGQEPEGALLQGMGHTYLWQDGFEWRALRNKRFTYARYLRDGRELLFDHTTDPSQKLDLSTVPAHLDDLNLLRGQMNQRMNRIGDSFEKCSWYRDHFTENRVIVSGARGIFHREFGADVPVDTSRPKPL